MSTENCRVCGLPNQNPHSDLCSWSCYENEGNIDDVKKQNKELVETVKFYANNSNWALNYTHGDGEIDIHYKTEIVLDCYYESSSIVYGGMLARETLKKLGIE